LAQPSSRGTVSARSITARPSRGAADPAAVTLIAQHDRSDDPAFALSYRQTLGPHHQLALDVARGTIVRPDDAPPRFD
jgi:hypothetical protein